MSGPQFFETVMGRQFYDGTMPRLARAVEQLVKVLEHEALLRAKLTIGAEALDRAARLLGEAGHYQSAEELAGVADVLRKA
jgi:hypothetical protein